MKKPPPPSPRAWEKHKPTHLTVSEAAKYFGCTRPSIYVAIHGEGLEPDAEGRYETYWLEEAIADHCPGISDRDDTKFGLWVRLTVEHLRLGEADREIAHICEQLGVADLPRGEPYFSLRDCEPRRRKMVSRAAEAPAA